MYISYMEGEGRKEEENDFKQWLLKISPNFCYKTTDSRKLRECEDK